MTAKFGGVTIKVNLPLRLLAIAGEIRSKCFIDVGTDHALLPIYTCLNDITDKVIACDINVGPLKTAKNNIKSFGLEGVIETRLCSGFCAVKPNEAKCAVIAGMGGGLIVDILKDSPDVVAELDRLILQPQLDVPMVRRYIHTIDFKILKERMIKETDKFYTVIVCERGLDSAYSEIEYLIGKKLIDEPDEVFKEYLLIQIELFKNIAQNIKNAKGNSDNKRKERLSELERLIKTYKGVLTAEL